MSSFVKSSFKNKKMEESLNSDISLNKTQKILSATPLKEREPLNKCIKINSMKHNTTKKRNYIKSAIDFYKRKNHRINLMNSFYKTKEKKGIQNLNKGNLSKNIFDESEIFQKKLSKKTQVKQKRISSILDSENKCSQDSILAKDLNDIFNRDKKNTFFRNEARKCDSTKIKNNSCINIFHKTSSNTILNQKENSFSKKIKSCMLSNPGPTRLLDRKKINGLPVTFPLYLSYRNTFNSIGEKNRIDKMISKLGFLKTYILKDNLNKFNIIKEFLWKNGFRDKKYFEKEALINLYHYLLKPFSFPNEYMLADFINEGINYKPSQVSYRSEKSEENNIMNYISKNTDMTERDQIITKTRNKIQSIESKNNGMSRKYSTLILNSKINMNKSLPLLIKELENEIKQISSEKSNKLKEYNDLFIKKQDMIKNIDKNKYIPNLCLLNQEFREKCQINIDKKNKKIVKYKNKQEQLKQINNRLFYNIVNKNKINNIDREEIQKNSKLTEFIFMERAKKYLLENPKNYNLEIFGRIKGKKSKL